MAKRLNDASGEVIEKNFLNQDADIPTESKVVVSTHVPKMMKVVFMNNRDPGVCLHFHYASKTHPLKHYDLMHGYTYELPEEVILHLEGQQAHDPYACHKRMYSRRMRDDGVSETYASSYVPYFQFKHVRAA